MSHQSGEWRGRRCRPALTLWVLAALLLAGGESPSAEQAAARKAAGRMTVEEAATIKAALAETDASFPEIAAPNQSQPSPEILPAPPEPAPSVPSPQSSWIQPDCSDEGVGRRQPFRLFRDRVEAIEQPRSPEQSWLYRPLSFGLFFGALFGTDLVSDWVSEKSGFLGGVRAGWDFDPYWGVEVRYAMGNGRLSDSNRAYAERDYWRQAIPSLSFNENTRFSARNLLDVSMLYYFWGDVRWRPYLLFGVGYASLRFDDLLGNHWTHTTVDMPLAIGVKYLCSDQFAIRLEAADSIIIGNADLETVHDFSLTLGLEVRLGGSRRSYWPWNPGDRYW